MIELVKPSVPEFEAFKSLAISIYIDELLKYKEYSTRQSATAYANEEVNSMLPLGLETPKQFIYFAQNTAGETVGYLWYVLESAEFLSIPQSFLAYIYILPEHRSKGIATQIMTLWENRLTEQHSVNFAYFYVFKENVPAINLYKKLGYLEESNFGWVGLSTSKRYFMAKKL